MTTSIRIFLLVLLLLLAMPESLLAETKQEKETSKQTTTKNQEKKKTKGLEQKKNTKDKKLKEKKKGTKKSTTIKKSKKNTNETKNFEKKAQKKETKKSATTKKSKKNIVAKKKKTEKKTSKKSDSAKNLKKGIVVHKKKTEDKKESKEVKKITSTNPSHTRIQPPFTGKNFTKVLQEARDRIRGIEVKTTLPEAKVKNKFAKVSLAKGFVYSLGPLDAKNTSSTITLDVRSDNKENGLAVYHGILTIVMAVDPKNAIDVMLSVADICRPSGINNKRIKKWNYTCVSKIDSDTQDTLLSFQASQI